MTTPDTTTARGRLTALANSREAGVQKDRERARRMGDVWGDEQLALARQWATVPSITLGDLQSVLAEIEALRIEKQAVMDLLKAVGERAEAAEAKLKTARVEAVRECVAIASDYLRELHDHDVQEGASAVAHLRRAIAKLDDQEQ